MSTACRTCGAELSLEQKICPNCGHGAPRELDGCAAGLLALFALLGLVLGGCGLAVTIATVGTLPEGADQTLLGVAVASLVAGVIMAGVSIWGLLLIRKRLRRRR